MILDSAGNLYGTTVGGGTVFELMPRAGAGWKEEILYSFIYNNGVNGFDPEARVIFDAAGNLYGTASGGGAYG